MFFDEWIPWVFEGIGTNIIGLLISLVVGGIGGFALGRFTKSKQLQKAGNDAKQKQSMVIENENEDHKKKGQKNVIRQKQVAGDNAEQIQTGRTQNGR